MPRALDFSESVSTEFLNDIQFQVYVGFIMYVTMVFAGLGVEYLGSQMVLNSDWDEDKVQMVESSVCVFNSRGKYSWPCKYRQI